MYSVFDVVFFYCRRGIGHGIVIARMDAKSYVARWISKEMGGLRLVTLII